MSRVKGPMSRVEGPMLRVEGPMSRVEGHMSKVEGPMSRVIFFSGFFVLLLAVGSISAAQSSPVYMFFPDLVKCSPLDSDIFLGPMSRVFLILFRPDYYL